MAHTLGQGWTTRLLAAMSALALTLASLIGSAAHACEASRHSQHRHHSSVSSQAGSQVSYNTAGHQEAATAATPVDAAHDTVAAGGHAAGQGPHMAVPAADLPQSDGGDRNHACCMDFICHGCIAVIDSQAGAQFMAWEPLRSLPWDAQAPASVSPARLDRPPKPLVSA
jgi:hypothetical protein